MHSNELIELNKRSNWAQKSVTGKIIKKPFHILQSKLLEVYCRKTGQSLERKVKTFWGADMIIVLPEVVSTAIDRYGFFEADLSKLFINNISKGMVVFDIGSHFGYYSKLSSWLVEEEGEVHAFEPTPSTFSILEKNTKGLSNTIINNNAVYSTESDIEILDFGIEYSAFNTLGTGNIPSEKRAKLKPKPFVVKAVTIDDYISQHNTIPNFVKIDAEGAEIHILKGMENTLKKHKPMLTLEVGDINIKQGEESPSRKLVDYMTNLNYQCFEYRHGELTPHKPRNVYKYDNLFFTCKD